MADGVVGGTDVLGRFFAGQRGATSIEYALVAGLVSVVIVGAVTGIGAAINAKFFGPLMNGFR